MLVKYTVSEFFSAKGSFSSIDILQCFNKIAAQEQHLIYIVQTYTVARLTPDQKVACSNHVGVITFFKSSV